MKYKTGYLFLAPFMILFIVFTLLPVLNSLYFSFSNYDIINRPTFAGFSNYLELFTDDDVFLISMRNTLLFALITGPIGFVMSFLFAWVIDQLKFQKFFALAFYAPSIVSGIAISVVWLYFFSPDRYGFINNILLRLGLTSTPILWTINPGTILGVIIFISLWMSMGSGFLTNLAGLKSIDETLYEAGAVDGIKNRFQELYHITVPSMKPQLLFNAIMAIVASFAVFDISVAITSFPSPEYAGHTIVAHLYDSAFSKFEMGYASSIAVVLFAMTFLLGRIFTKIFSTKGE
jgi:multiple sugar transport system permease protein